MTAFDSQLLLHLRLDALPGGRVQDGSSHARHGVVTGNPQVVPDDLFGSSIRFSGKDTVEVPGVQPSAGGTNPVLSVTAWVLLDAYPSAREWLLTLGQAGPGALHWLVEPNGQTQLGVWNGGQVSPLLPLNTWIHVATTYDGATLRCYLDGKLFEQSVPATFSYTSWTFDLAKPQLGEAGYAGRLAGVRVYERALSDVDVQAVIDDDQSAMAAFRRSHPLSFSLLDTDDQPVLAIVEDPTGQDMRLDVTNDASQTITLAPIDPTTGPSSHLELSFRPGTLPLDWVDRLSVATPAGWTGEVSKAPDGTVSVALTAAEQREIKANETVQFGLHDIGADGRGGTRGTRVQLRYAQMYYPDEPSALDGTRVQYLSLINRRGQKQIPLDVGFIGFNTILSDGRSTSPLRLRIVNLSSLPIPLVPSGQEDASAFILSFETQKPGAPVDEWALGTPEQLKSIVVTADNWVAAPPTEEGQSLAWRLTTPTQIAIAPDDDIHIAVDGLIGRPPSGHTTLYLHYENIPGYWDGYLTATIEKSPLICRDVTLPDNSVDSRVGIGTANPNAKLHVVGGAIMPSAGNGANAGIQFPSDPGGGAGDAAWIRYYPRSGEATTLEIGIANDPDDHIALVPSGGVGVNTTAPEGKLQILHTPQDANGNAVIVGPTTGANLRLGYHTDYSWIQSHGAKPLVVNSIGNPVGIARTVPEGTLDVDRGSAPGGTAIFRGTQRFSHFNYSTGEDTYIRGGKAASNVYLNDTGGNVAIGSTDPQGHMLLVNGPAKVTGLRINSASLFGRVQWGNSHAGTHTGGVKEVLVTFPERFGTTPHAVVTARSQGYYTDTFAITVKYIDAGTFKVNIQRTDAMNAAWGQDLLLDWIAWE